MDSFINTFHIDWKIIIAQAFNFIVVLFILQYLALKPIKKLMKERTERINNGLNNADKNEEILKNTKEEYEKIIIKAKSEAQEIFLGVKKEAEEKKEEMLQNTGIEVENMIENGKKILNSEKVKMVNEAKNEIVSLVVKSTEKLLETHVDTSIDKRTLDQIKKI